MTSPDKRTSPRGPYAQGRKRREAILTAALEVIGQQGYRSTSLQEIARRAGITPAGVLHHFGSKEGLLAEVLRRRDEVNWERFAGGDDHYPMAVHVSQHNASVPGLIELYVQTAADAADPQHPLHDFFVERDARVLASVTRDIERRQAAGTFSREVDAAKFARVVLSLADGLQAEWIIDRDIDLAGTLAYVWDLFAVDVRVET